MGTYREVLPVSPPGGEDTDDAAGNDIGRVVPVVHGTAYADERRARDRGEEDPALDRVSLAVEGAHLGAEEEGQVPHAGPRKAGVARGEAAESLLQVLRLRTDLPRREAVHRVCGVVGWRSAAREQVGARASDSDLMLVRLEASFNSP